MPYSSNTNIIADRGSENSRIYKNNGLVYRILDNSKQKVGVPIKASLIYSKPTLKNIEANFERNEAESQIHKRRVTNAIDFILLKRSNQSLQSLIAALQKENIHVVLRQNNNGITYGITYVDHKTKCVFNGSHLGKPYSANAIQQRCAADQSINPKQQQSRQQSSDDEVHEINRMKTGLSKVYDDLMQPENNKYANEPSEQKKFKKKRKRKQHQSHG